MRLSRQDVRLAVRSFVRRPGFAIVAILSLGLGIALNTTMYSVLDAMLYPHTNIRDADEVIGIGRFWGDYHGKVDATTRNQILRSALTSAVATTSTVSARGFGTPVAYGNQFAQTGSSTVAPNYFQVLGIPIAQGRAFTDDDYFHATRSAIITQKLAEKLSPDHPMTIGAKIDIIDQPYTVIGIVDRADTRSDPYFWTVPDPSVPLDALPINMVRVKPKSTVVQVGAQLDLAASQIASLAGDDPRGDRFDFSFGGQVSQFRVGRFDWALVAAVVAVLFIACANLANLQLARGIGRGRELAVRAALGASRADIIAQLLTESAILAVGGLLVGMVLTVWGGSLLKAHVPPSVADIIIAPQMSIRVLGVAAIACAVCVLFVGLLPAIRVSRVDPNELLKSGAGTGAGKRNRRQYALMIVIEMGLALTLLTAGSIVVRAAVRVRETKLGFDPKPLAEAQQYFSVGHDSIVTFADLTSYVAVRAAAVPNVESAAIEYQRSIKGWSFFAEEPKAPPREVRAPMYGYQVVSPNYFRTYGRSIVKGRDFIDGNASEPEAIVDRRTAHALWPGIDPIGRQIKLGDFASNAQWVRVVGVVSSLYDEVDDGELRSMSVVRPNDLGELYIRAAANDTVNLRSFSLLVVARAKSNPASLPIALVSHFGRGGAVRFAWAQSIEDALRLVFTRERYAFVGSTFAVFAVLAVGLAALGIYGVVAHSVAERRRELGVRLALGATGREIIRVVIREGNPMALAGVALGLYLTKRTMGMLHAFSFDGDETDVILFTITAAALFAVAVTAALVPALRATRIDPVESLRNE